MASEHPDFGDTEDFDEFASCVDGRHTQDGIPSDETLASAADSTSTAQALEDLPLVFPCALCFKTYEDARVILRRRRSARWVVVVSY